MCFATLCSINLAAHAQKIPEKSLSAATVVATAFPLQTPLPQPSALARDLFSRYKDRLVQVRVLLDSANEQSSLGSGFVVKNEGAKGAWLLTNYHAI